MDDWRVVHLQLGSREPGEAGATTALAEAPQELPEQEAAPVSTPNDAGTPAPAQRTAAVSGSAPSDAGTPAPAERTAQVQVKALGPRVAQWETPGPLAARITGNGAGVPGKPVGKGHTGKGG